MSKMSDMSMTIEELRNAAVAINDAANWLAQQFGGASEAAEKAEEDTIAANGIPDIDDISAINAANDTTAKNTAESAATDTEDTTTDTTASTPTADAPATDTNAESR